MACTAHGVSTTPRFRLLLKATYLRCLRFSSERRLQLYKLTAAGIILVDQGIPKVHIAYLQAEVTTIHTEYRDPKLSNTVLRLAEPLQHERRTYHSGASAPPNLVK